MLERLSKVLKRDYLGSVFLVIILITAVNSGFDFYPDLKIWGYEILRNFIMVTCITFAIVLTGALFDIITFDGKIRNVFLFLLIFLIAGPVGGFIGWQINELFIGFRVTSFYFFVIKIGLLSLFFGIAAAAYLTLKEKLSNTILKLAEKEINEQKLLRLKEQAELKALRARVNPHFLFNTLNSISSLIYEDPGKAEELIERLAALFRYTLTSTEGDLTKVSAELSLLKEYLEIEKVRLGNRLDYEIICDEKSGGLSIPGMLLQPLVENSVIHGIAPSKKGGKITINCFTENGYGNINILDSGQGFDSININEGFGLGSTKERLGLMYGEDFEFKIKSENGVEITIKFPAN